MSATTVLLVRHASHGDVGRVLTGRKPGVALAESGRREAARLAEHLRGTEVDAVYASPVQRAVETAEPVAAALGLPVRPSEALDEIDFGEWTGTAFSDLAADPRWDDWNRARQDGCPPGGEPMRAVQARVAAALDAWRERHPDGRVLAVSHADVIKAALCHVLGLSLDRHAAFDVDPASVSTLVVWSGGGKVVGLNRGPAA